MDLSQARTSDTAELEVTHPKAGKTDIVIEVAGKDSEIYEDEFAGYRKQLLNQANDSETLDNEKSRKLVAEFLAKITVSWQNVQYEGEDLECTYDNAYKLYADRSLTWLRDQVDNFANKRANFLGN